MIETLTIAVTGISSLYLIFLSIIFQVKNVRSAVVFKFFPFILGLMSGIVFLKLVDIL